MAGTPSGPLLAAIRGLRSAASLKPLVDLRRWPHEQPIRGLRSAASLKPRMDTLSVSGERVDPRTQIRGLIEAVPTQTVTIEAGPIRGLRSAASLKRVRCVPGALDHGGDPRTQIRGLIEACVQDL